MTLFATPKPERAPRLAAKKAAQDAAKGPRLSRQRKERITNYGRRRDDPEGMTGPEFKRFILARDRNRCIIPNCTTPTLGVTAHHIKHVGAGGKNDPENGASLCANHHDAEERGELSRQTIRDELINRGHITMLSRDDLDEFDQRLGIVRTPTA